MRKLCFDRFGADLSGSVAVITAILLPVVLMAAGAALDYGRAAKSRVAAQAATDAAALAVARAKLLNEDNLEDLGEKIYKANFKANSGSETKRTEVRITDEAVTVVAENTTPTHFGGLFGMSNMQSEVRSTVHSPTLQAATQQRPKSF